MARSPSSSAQRARAEVADRLREMRLDAKLTARALSVAAGWHESKTSRIEAAKQAIGDEDITTWCRVCGAEGQMADLIVASRAADSMYVEWRRLHRSGMRRAQAARVPLYESTRHMRVYTSTVVPGLVQTPAYATALMSAITRFQKTPNDVDEAVTARMERNRVLHNGDHRFALVLEESVLRYRIGDAETMADQMKHLLSVMSLPSVSLGVIPHAVGEREVWPLETFTIFDTERVHVELLSAQVTMTSPGEIEVYTRAFAQQARLAAFGRSARELITAAISTVE